MATKTHKPKAHRAAPSKKATKGGRNMRVVNAQIVKKAGICGGDACVAGTRIPVWVLERSRQLEIPIDDILEDYPSISWGQLLAAWQYAEDHRQEIEAQIRENEND